MSDLRTPLFYRTTLMLLPRRFRERHGAAMRAAFGEARSDAIRRGRRAAAVHGAREVWDVLRAALALRVRGFRRSVAERLHGGGRAHSALRGGTAPGPVAGGLRDDVGFAVRSVTRHRVFFLFASLTLALGVGSATAIWSALESIVLDPLPYAGGERTVLPWRTMGSAGGSLIGLEGEQSAAVAAERDVFEATATFYAGSMTLTGMGDPERIETMLMGPELAGFMGLRPVLGRLFTTDELRGDGERLVLLSWGMWKRRFGGRRDVMGQTLELDGQSWTVIGVMPRRAVRPNGEPVPVDVWLPLPERHSFLQAVARLRPGVSLQQAAERVDQIVKRTSGEGDGALGGTVIGGTALRAGGLNDSLRLLMAAVSLLLLVACVNVSSLLLQRALVRRVDTAVRMALGVGRARLARQFVLESLAVALAGAVFGIGFAWVGLRAMMAFRPDDLTALQLVRLDGSVVAFSFAVSMLAGILSGLAPALHGARARETALLARASREGGSAFARFRWALVSAEVALCFALLVGATLVIGSLSRLAQRDPGFRPDGLVVLNVRLPAWRYAEAASPRELLERLTERVRQLPGVQHVTQATGVPPSSGIRFGRIEVPGRGADQEATLFFGGEVGAGFLTTLGQPILSGRDFQADDMQADPVPVILGESAARRIFSDGDAVGRAFRFEGKEHTVIGVARDIRVTGLDDAGTSLLGYWPLPRIRSAFDLLIRIDHADAPFLAALRDVLRAAEPEALVDVASMPDLLRATIARQRFTTSLLSGFGGLALLLAAIGLYGVLAHAVSGRTHEIGVRVALGADAGRIRRLVLYAAASATLAGLATGAFLALAGLRLLGRELFGLQQNRPDAWVVAALLVTIVAVAASWVPARRAARIDPVLAMRGD